MKVRVWMIFFFLENLSLFFLHSMGFFIRFHLGFFRTAGENKRKVDMVCTETVSNKIRVVFWEILGQMQRSSRCPLSDASPVLYYTGQLSIRVTLIQMFQRNKVIPWTPYIIRIHRNFFFFFHKWLMELLHCWKKPKVLILPMKHLSFDLRDL